MKSLKLLNRALVLLGISFLLSCITFVWTFSDPYLYDTFWTFNIISLLATIFSIISLIIGIAYGLLIAHWMKKKNKL